MFLTLWQIRSCRAKASEISGGARIQKAQSSRSIVIAKCEGGMSSKHHIQVRLGINNQENLILDISQSTAALLGEEVILLGWLNYLWFR